MIQDQAGFHLRSGYSRMPANVRLVPLPPYSPELNPVEKLGGLVKDAICNRLFADLRTLETAILAEQVALIHRTGVVRGARPNP